MKIWKSVVQNVLSGCVGGVLVMGAAQAQKSAQPATQYEVRTRSLVLVDNNNKKCAEFSALGGSPTLRMDCGKSFMDLSTNLSGCSISAGAKGNRYAMIDVRDHETSLKMSNAAYSAWLEAGNREAKMTLLKNPKLPENGAPPPSSILMPAEDRAKLDTHTITASVDDETSSLVALGPKSDVTVGSEKACSFGSLDYNEVKNSGSIYLSGADNFHWSQPPRFGQNQQ